MSTEEHFQHEENNGAYDWALKGAKAPSAMKIMYAVH
jgi:hypothetical protein